ncbi:MAG: hypothetical protein GX979_07715 [Firmicutes bacterium]|nr:hypothetical protein [Bacillota bacterium]
MIVILQRYYTDPWLQELHTKILDSFAEGDRHLVVLEETIFYPTGGGQPHDLGSINQIPLLDVFERDGTVVHVLEHAPVGDEAYCVLDWSRRLDHMQQHSGQHLLSAVLQEHFGYRTESFHLGEDYSTIDISTPNLSEEEQRSAEQQANELVFSNLPLLTYTLKPNEQASVPLRKIPDLEGDLRIVEIEGFDYSPCAGTHVQSTSQIGLVKIIKCEKYKGMTRVYFLCGNRSLEDYRRKQKVCLSLGSLLSVSESDLPSRVALEVERKQELEKQIEELQTELMDLHAQSIVAREESPFFLELPKATIEEAQKQARSILNLTTGTVIISLDERFVLMHNQPNDLHLGQFIREKAQPLGGRGGGNATSAQVYFPDPDGYDKFSKMLKTDLL